MKHNLLAIHNFLKIARTAVLLYPRQKSSEKNVAYRVVDPCARAGEEKLHKVEGGVEGMERARERGRAGCPHSHMGPATTGPDLRPFSGRIASQREEPSVLNALHAGGSSYQTESTETPRLSRSVCLPRYHCLCLPYIVAMTQTFS